MPPRHCCCGPCYTYNEDFVRYDEFDVVTSDASYLEPDWEVCGSWSDWQLNYLGPSNGQLENTVAGAKVVLKHMVGNPYGILRVHIQIIEGATYRVHVFHGTEGTPCTGEHIIVEVECGPDPNEGTLRIIQGSTTLEEVEFSGISDDDLFICVGDRIIEASLTSTDDTLRYCGEVSGYWFALEGVTHPDADPAEAATLWSDLQYSDHWEHDKRCPLCSKHCCFPLFNKVIAGFLVTISGIAEGTDGDCNCANLLEFYLEVAPDTDLCECVTTYSIDGVSGTVGGPHGCPGLSENVSQPTITMDCDNETRLINWQFDMFILSDNDSEVHAQTTFDPDTDPADITATGLTFYDTGNGASCNYESATIEFTPVLVNDCCSEAISEPMSVAMDSDPTKQFIAAAKLEASVKAKKRRIEKYHSLWSQIHGYAATHSNAWNPDATKSFYETWVSHVPRRGCQCNQHWSSLTKTNPPDFSSPKAFFEWAWLLHDLVSKHHSKAKRISLAEAYALYWPTHQT